MIAMVNHGIDRCARLGGTHEFRPAEHLRNEQKRAVQQILDSRDFAVNLRGAAGTGKTAALQEIDRGLRMWPRSHSGCAHAQCGGGAAKVAFAMP